MDPCEEKVHLLTSLPFFAIHIAALGVLLVPFAWSYVVVALALYYVRMFGLSAGYHRYFSHRTYKTSRPFRFVLAWLGSTAAQKGVLWWAATHREHHRYSDTERDPHSPVERGFWWAHVGWILRSKHRATRLERVHDLAGDPELRWLNRWHLVPPILLAIGLFLIGGLPLFLWGFCVSTVLLWHGTFAVNSLAHVYGSVRYRTRDQSRNNWWLALLTLGEGWHNNHHHAPGSVNQGFFWWEIDVSDYVLRLLRRLGIVWDLRRHEPRALEPVGAH